jgi:hypothetical protein
MRPTRLAAAALVLATAVLVLLAAPAVAGGPTSVLLVAPGGGGTASLYYDDADYGVLSRLVGAEGQDGTASSGSAGHETETSVTVTWLIHDVSVWRIDRIYLGGEGGPWLATQEGFGDDVLSSAVTWHRPAEPAALVALLDRLGLEPGNGSSAVVPPPAPPAAEPAPAPTARATAPAQPAGTPWRLLALAALAGAVATAVVAVPLVRRAAAASVSDDGAGDDVLSWPPEGHDVGERPVSAQPRLR